MRFLSWLEKLGVGNVLVSCLGTQLGLLFDAAVFQGSWRVSDSLLTDKLIKDVKIQINSLTTDEAISILNASMKSVRNNIVHFDDRVTNGFASNYGLCYTWSGRTQGPYANSVVFAKNVGFIIPYDDLKSVFIRKNFMKLSVRGGFTDLRIHTEKEELARFIAAYLKLAPNVNNIVVTNRNYYFSD